MDTHPIDTHARPPAADDETSEDVATGARAQGVLSAAPSEAKPSAPGQSTALWVGLGHGAAALADWLAHRRRPHDPWRHALSGLARYLRRRL